MRKEFDAMPVGENRLTPMNEFQITSGVGTVCFFDSPEHGAKEMKKLYKNIFTGGHEECGWDFSQQSLKHDEDHILWWIRDRLYYHFWDDSPLRPQYTNSERFIFSAAEGRSIFNFLLTKG